VEGDPKLVRLYHQRIVVEHVFRAGDTRLNLDNLRWKGAAKVQMHLALCHSVILAVAITAHQMGRPDMFYASKRTKNGSQQD